MHEIRLEIDLSAIKREILQLKVVRRRSLSYAGQPTQPEIENLLVLP